MATQVKLHFNGKKWLKCTDTTGRCPYGADAHRIAGSPTLASTADLNAALDSIIPTVDPLKEAVDEARKTYDELAARYNANDETLEYSDYVDARYNKNELEFFYNQTPAGIAALQANVANAKTDEEKANAEVELRFAENSIRKAKEKAEFDAKFGGSLAPTPKDAYTIGPSARGGDPLWTETTGSKYDKNATVKDIAANVKKDILDAQKRGYLPTHVEFKTNFSSTNNEIGVKIVGADDKQILSPEVDEVYRTRKYTEDALELMNRVEKIMNAYRFTRFDELEHHVNLTNFWSRCRFEDNWEREERLEREAKKK